MTRLLVLALLKISLHGTQTLEINYNPVDISSYDKQELYALNMYRLINYIYLNGYYCVEQGPYMTHNECIATDITIFLPKGEYLEREQDYIAFGLFWESLDNGNKWGGHDDIVNVHRFEAKL